MYILAPTAERDNLTDSKIMKYAIKYGVYETRFEALTATPVNAPYDAFIIVEVI